MVTTIPCHPADVPTFDSPEMLYTRLTDGEPVLKSVCSWCQRLLRDGALPISHGICATCQAKAFAELDASDAARREAVEDAAWDRMQVRIAADIAKQDAPPPPELPVGPPIAHAVTELTPAGWVTTAIAGAPTAGVSVDVICIPFPAALEGRRAVFPPDVVPFVEILIGKAVVDVALVPVPSQGRLGPVVEVALVPVEDRNGL